VIERDGKTCAWCGYPIDVEDTRLCVTCREWIDTTGTADNAVAYAQREGEKERQQRWEGRR
jgi:hypothetical protein